MWRWRLLTAEPVMAPKARELLSMEEPRVPDRVERRAKKALNFLGVMVGCFSSRNIPEAPERLITSSVLAQYHCSGRYRYRVHSEQRWFVIGDWLRRETEAIKREARP